MGLFDSLKGKDKGNGTKPPAPQAEPITVFDEHGRELKIDRATWVAEVLPPNLKKAWSDADDLYGVIVQALSDGLSAEVVSAAERLVTIDGASERALIVHAIALLKNGDLAGAERVLEACRNKHGATGSVLTNLAKIYAERREEQRSLATLRQALEVEPNHENALAWWSALAEQRGGEAAYVEALGEIAALPGAWLPQLWLARAALERGERARAFGLYDDVLSRAAREPGVLMMISGDLGNAGALEELVRLTLPHYDLGRDGFEPGLNLAQALKELGRNNEARDMVRRLQKLNIAPIAGRLARLEAEIAGQQRPK